MRQTRKQALIDFFERIGFPVPLNPSAKEAIHYYVVYGGSDLFAATEEGRIADLKKANDHYVGRWVQHKTEIDPPKLFVVAVLPKTNFEIERSKASRVTGVYKYAINPFKAYVKTSRHAPRSYTISLHMFDLVEGDP